MSSKFDVPTYVFIWYGYDGDENVSYIIRQSKFQYRSREAAFAAAKMEHETMDIPCRHGGPYLQMIMIPEYISMEEHLKNFGEMLVKQLTIKQHLQ